MAHKVLVADDSIASQRLFEMVLTQEGYDVITVGSGPEVLEQIREKQPDIALIDAIMPEADGYQICETLKNNPNFKNLPVILLAGIHEAIDQEKASKIVGTNGILNKPAKSTVIIAKVKEFLTLQEAETDFVEQALPGEKPLVEPERYAEVIEEPLFVQEEYAFDEDSEEADLVVESEILDEEAEREEAEREFEIQGEKDTLEESLAETEEEFSLAEHPVADVVEEASAPIESLSEIKTVELSDEKLDMIADEIAQRLAGKLIPVLMQEFSDYLMQFPAIKKTLEGTSKRLVKVLWPEIHDKLR